MNKATEEYKRHIQRAEAMAAETPDSYYAGLSGALQAMLAAEIQRRTGEFIDYSVIRATDAAKGKAA